jgi:hypothetical protein
VEVEVVEVDGGHALPGEAHLCRLRMERKVQHSIQEQLLRSNEKQFRGGLVFKARRLVVSLSSRPRVIKKKKKKEREYSLITRPA